MNRRQFFRDSFLVSGLALSSGALKAESLLGGSLKPVDRYLAFIGAEMVERQCDDCLESLVKTRSESLWKVGYAQKGRPYALDKEENTLVYRYELLSAESGCVDTCLLFFEKDTSGGWVYSATLIGFHLDALASMIEEPSLAGRTGPMDRDSVIPSVARRRSSTPGVTGMRKGAVKMTVRIEDNAHRISVSLFPGAPGGRETGFSLSRTARNHFWA